MSTAAVGSGHFTPRRLWYRQLDRYPANSARYLSLAIVVATTIVLYYQLYLSGGVATAILRNLHMSFTYFVNISVVSYLAGGVASYVAGLADRWGRANIVTGGLALVGLLCTFGLPNAHTKAAFLVIYVLIGFVEGIILVATPALVRDFSPQLGRASAMGFWTLGPVLGSLVVAAFVSGAGTRSWQDQYRISGIIGLVVFAVALVGLRELSPRLRDQLMVSMKDRALIEARAAGIDVEESLRRPFRQMLHADVLLSAFAISVFLIIYYVAVGFFPVFFETIFGYTQSKANTLGDWFWAFDAGGLLLVGVVSDRLRVRKPFMVFGAACAIASTLVFALHATNAKTSYTFFVVILSCIAVSLALGFAPWMASFTETVERRNPALIATGLAVWGLVIRIVIAVTIFFVPKIVTTATTLVQQGPIVQSVLASPAPVGQTTIGKVATAAAANPTVVAKLKLIAASKTTPTAADVHFLTVTAPAALGAANLAALAHPTPALTAALTELAANGPAVQSAASRSPHQWRTLFLVGVGGEIVFVPLILLMAGFWDPRAAKRAELEHDEWLARELEALPKAPASP